MVGQVQPVEHLVYKGGLAHLPGAVKDLKEAPWLSQPLQENFPLRTEIAGKFTRHA
jgi:hypothetical protein